MPAAIALDVMNSNGNSTEAVNSMGNAGNKCPKGKTCWDKYMGKWKTKIDGKKGKVDGQNAIYEGIDGTCGVSFCFFGNVNNFKYFLFF
jgi:hypothetical protein